MAMAHRSGNSGSVLGGGFEYKIPVKNWAHGLESGGKSGVFKLDDFNPYVAGDYDVATIEGSNAVAQVLGSPVGEVALKQDEASTVDDVANIIAKRDGGLSVNFAAGKQSAAAIRLKVDSIAEKCSVFVGLIDGNTADGAALVTDTTGVMGAFDGCGLHLKDAAASMDLIYGTDLSDPTEHKLGAKVLVADTYVNFSVHCDGTNVLFFIDGSQVGGKVPRANVAAADLRLGVLTKQTTNLAADKNITIDSMAAAQER